MAGKQGKIYRAGQKKPNNAGVIQKGVRQGIFSKNQSGKTHSVKNIKINHGRIK